jgi:hypothetical protein
MPSPTPKAQIVKILLRQRRQAHGHTGKIDTLMIPDRPAGNYFCAHRGTRHFDYAKLDRAIGQQDAVAGLDVRGEVGISGGGALAIANE